METTDPDAGPDAAHAFRLDITDAVLTRVESDQLVVRWWHEGSGERTVRRA